MVNVDSDSGRAAERALALRYAPVEARAAVATLFALDARLRAITLAARDPTIGLMRLTWWGDALVRLDSSPPPAEPLLREIAAELLPRGVSGWELESLADAWSRLLEAEPIDLPSYATERGLTLFCAAEQLLGPHDEQVMAIAPAWALADLATLRPEVAEAARALALAHLPGAFRQPLTRALRALGALGLTARFDLEGRGRAGSPARVARLLAHRLTGR